jgi:membrane protein implicated in regulation of membrane protease activity
MYLTAADPNASAMRWLQDVMSSWPVQLLAVVLYVGLAVLAFTRVSRDWQDEGGTRNRYFLGSVVALGVFVILQFVLGSSMFGIVNWPTWLYLIEVIWLFAMWLYYFIRFMTRTRSGPGDDETRRRGAALEGVIAPMSDEAHHSTSA